MEPTVPVWHDKAVPTGMPASLYCRFAVFIHLTLDQDTIMKKISLIFALLLLVAQPLFAAESDTVRLSAGPVMMYDAFNQEVGIGGQFALGYRLNSSWEAEVYGATTSHFDVDTDLTDGDASVSMLTLGGRYVSSMGTHSKGYISAGIGALELEAEHSLSDEDDSRCGGVARFGVGVDVPLTDHIGMTCGAGFNRGFGDTDEVILFDLTTSLFCSF